MKLNRRVVILIALLILPSIILVCSIFNRQKRLRLALENSPEAFAKHDADTLKEWRQFNYVSLQLTNEIRNGISNLITSDTNHALLSSHQQDKLMEEFNDLFDAYSVGIWEAYKNFRFPTNIDWRWRSNIVYSVRPPYSAEQSLDRYYKQGPTFGSEAMATNFFNHYGADYKAHRLTRAAPVGMDARFKEYVYQFSDCSYYSNFLTGVNFDKSKLFITQTKVHRSLQSVAFYPVQNQKCSTMPRPFPNLGYMDSVEDGIGLLEFNHSIQNVITNTGSVLTVDAFFYVNTSPPDAPFPIIIRFYWSPDDGRWLPDDLILGVLNTFFLRYPIF